MNGGDDIHVFGAGGHSKVVISTLQQLGYGVGAVFDDDPQKIGKSVMGVPVIGIIDDFSKVSEPRAVIAVGDNEGRLRIAEQFDADWITLVHPRACVAADVLLGPGALEVRAGPVRHEPGDVASAVGRRCRPKRAMRPRGGDRHHGALCSQGCAPVQG